MKKYELRLAHRQEVSELEDEKVDLQRNLQEACSREASAVLGRTKLSDVLGGVRNELAAANVSWAKAKESERAAMSAKALAEKRTAEKQAELTDVTKERDTLRRQVQAIRKAFEALHLAIHPYTWSPHGLPDLKGGVMGPTGTFLTGLIKCDPPLTSFIPGLQKQVTSINGGAVEDRTEPWVITHSPATSVITIADAKAAHPATFGWVETSDEKVDRLHEAGYSCATQKAKANAEAQMSAYSGLR